MRVLPALLTILLLGALPAMPLPALQARDTASGGEGDLPERLSRIEQAMWSRDARAIPFLREWSLSDPHDMVRERSLGALALLEDAGAREIFLDRLARDPAPRVRRAAAEAIGILKLPVPPARLMQPLEKDPDPLVRTECARAIGLIGLRAGGFALMVRFVQDPSPEVRALSAESLGRLRLPEAAELLRSMTLLDNSVLVRIHAVRALAELSPSASQALFEDVMESDDYPDLRIEAFRGLLRSGSSGSRIEAGLADSDEGIRFLAFQEWLRVRPAASSSSSSADDAETVSRIKSFLSDPVPGIRDLAKETLEAKGYKIRPSGFGYVVEE